MNPPWRSILLRAGLLFTLLLSANALNRFIRPISASGQLQSLKWQAVVGAGAGATLLFLVLFLLSWTKLEGRMLSWFDDGIAKLRRLGRWNLFILAAAVVGLVFLMYGRLGGYFSFYPRLLLFWLMGLAGSVLLRAGGFERGWAELLGCSLLLTAAGFRIGSYLSDLSTYPLTMGWSEASRFYYASLYFSQRIYDTAVSPTFRSSASGF